jgi:probable F420-dependent oxidoreductase
VNKNITIGFQLAAQYGDMKTMRNAWVKAEELGADRIYTSDHLCAVKVDSSHVSRVNTGEGSVTLEEKVFEATAIQAAMAVTTSRVQIGCNVHGNSYRNPNMMAYIANTIDHLSGGRFLLGMGTGYTKQDYDAFGYEYGTQNSRSLAFERDIPIILDRFTKLNPPPLHHIPIMIASMGEKIGMRTVARHADIWHFYGPYETMLAKAEVLKSICKEVGRDIKEIEFATNYWPSLLKGSNDTLEKYVEMGVKHIIVFAEGPNWDLGLLREVLAWRDGISR